MKRLARIASTLCKFTIPCSAHVAYSARVGVLALLSILVLGSSPVSALPKIASGSNCNSNWVNNSGALDCFILGEDEGNRGVTNPHYVACSTEGDIFCCVNNKSGDQDCVAVNAVVEAGPPVQAKQIAAILASQQTTLMMLSRLSNKVDTLNTKVDGMNGKAATAPALTH